MLKEPKRGAFDYLLHGNAIHDEPPVPPINGGPPRRVRIDIEIIERRKRGQERDSVLGLIFLHVLPLLFFAVIAAAAVVAVTTKGGH